MKKKKRKLRNIWPESKKYIGIFNNSTWNKYESTDMEKCKIKFLVICTPRVPVRGTPRGKNYTNEFLVKNFCPQQILWVNTRWLTPRLSFYHKKWLSYGFLKFWGYPRGAKFQTPVKPKIWVREQKSSGFLNNSPRATFTPKKSKFYFLRVFSLTDLSWNHPFPLSLTCSLIQASASAASW